MKKFMRGEFSFDGIMMRQTYGIAVEKVHDMILPPPRTRKISIPHRDGRYDYGAKNWEERTLILDCNVAKVLSRAELRELSHLLSKKATIILWSEPDKYYAGQICNPDVFNKIGRGQQSFSLEFTCEPYAYGTIGTHELLGGSNPIDYKGTAETPCLIVLRNDGETAVSDVQITTMTGSTSYTGVYQYSLTRFSLNESDMRDLQGCLLHVTLNPGDELRLNSEDFTATLNGENVLHLQEGEWIRMSRDVSAMSITGNGGELNGSLIYEERWL